MTTELTTPIQTEIDIEYRDFDEYDIDRVTVGATIERDGDTAILTADGLKARFGEKPFGDRSEDPDAPLVLTVGELRGTVAIYRDSTTTASADGDAGTVSVSQLNHDGKYVEAVHSQEFAQLLASMEETARDRFATEHEIETVAGAGVSVPDVTLVVEEQKVSYPSSKSNRNSRPVETLVAVVDGDEPDEWDAWLTAAREAGVRRDTYGRAFTSTIARSVDNETLLFAPRGYDAGETLTLTEWVDATYNLDPNEFAEVGHGQAAEAAAQREYEAAREELVDQFPDLKRLSFEPREAREAFDQAAESGECVAFATGGSECNDSSLECSWDLISYRATPDGEVTTKRTHTY